MASQPQASRSSLPTKLFAKLPFVGKAMAKPNRAEKTVRSRFTTPIMKIMRRKNGIDAKKEQEALEDALERGPSILDKLPYDVLLAILLHMELSEVQAMSQVCSILPENQPFRWA